jgi:hypothetical protein
MAQDSDQSYSQWSGRDELFEKERHQETVPGWPTCTLADAATE